MVGITTRAVRITLDMWRTGKQYDNVNLFDKFDTNVKIYIFSDGGSWNPLLPLPVHRYKI
jgi:hypothetical protein